MNGERDVSWEKLIWERIHYDICDNVEYLECYRPHSEVLDFALSVKSLVEEYGYTHGFMEKDDE